VKELLIVLGSAWALAVTLGRLLLVDEIKGWMSGRRDHAVEEAIASLSDDERALFEDDWRATYSKYKDRPLSASRCAREFTLSARNLARDRTSLDENFELHAESIRTSSPDGTGRVSPSRVIRQLFELAKTWTDIDLEVLGAPFSRKTLATLVPALRALGSLLACSAIVSGSAMFVALRYVTGSGPLVAAAASIVSAIAMWRLDRLMAVSILSRGGSFVSAIPRVVLTAITSLAVAQPLVIQVFSREIESMIPNQAGHAPNVFQAMRALDGVPMK
jgi:hypothetical protein